MQMINGINWPPVIFVIYSLAAPFLIFYCIRKGNQKAVVFVSVAFFVLLAWSYISSPTVTVRVVAAESKLQHYQPILAAMGVNSVSVNKMPIFNKTFSTLSAHKNGKFIEDTSIDNGAAVNPPSQTNAFNHYLAKGAAWAFSIFVPTEGHPLVVVKLKNGKVIVEARRELFEPLGDDRISAIAEGALVFHLERLSKVEGLPRFQQ